MKDLIGRKMKGFKFEDELIKYDKSMKKHIGEIGEIIDVNTNFVQVSFQGVIWYYPLDQIEQHLIPEDPTAEAIKLLESKGYKVTKEIPIGALCLFADEEEKFNKNIGTIKPFEGMMDGNYMSGIYSWKYCKQIIITDV